MKGWTQDGTAYVLSSATAARLHEPQCLGPKACWCEGQRSTVLYRVGVWARQQGLGYHHRSGAFFGTFYGLTPDAERSDAPMRALVRSVPRTDWRGFHEATKWQGFRHRREA